jgi:curved DNA-binding protein CbpA
VTVTHYDTLEISPKASADVVRAAYRSLIQRFHPDRNAGDDAAAERAVAITRAYEVLSNAASRGAYDEQLRAAAEGPMRGPASRSADRGPSRPSRRVHAGDRRVSWHWTALAAVVVAGALWLGTHEKDAGVELASIRQAFDAADAPEARRRQLYARKEALLQQDPALRLEGAAEYARQRAARTVDLLDAPLVLKSDKHEITIARLRVVLGTFDAPSLRARIERQRQQLARELAQRIAVDARVELIPTGGEAFLRAVLAGVLNNLLDTLPKEDYPSTYFESPGRHGVVDVILPESFIVQVR